MSEGRTEEVAFLESDPGCGRHTKDHPPVCWHRLKVSAAAAGSVVRDYRAGFDVFLVSLRITIGVTDRVFWAVSASLDPLTLLVGN